MNDQLISKIAMNITTILLNAMKNSATEEPISPDTFHSKDGTAVDEVMNQLTEHIMMELTKALIERAKRVKVDEVPSSSATETVRRLGVEVAARITKSMDDSSADLAKNIGDAKIILGDMQGWGRKQWSGAKKNDLLTYISQLNNILE